MLKLLINAFYKHKALNTPAMYGTRFSIAVFAVETFANTALLKCYSKSLSRLTMPIAFAYFLHFNMHNNTLDASAHKIALFYLDFYSLSDCVRRNFSIP